MCLGTLILGAYTFKMIFSSAGLTFSLYNDFPFFFHYFFIFNNFSDRSISVAAFFYIPSAWNIFFQPFTFGLEVK
jgi:hypothetical protein